MTDHAGPERFTDDELRAYLQGRAAPGLSADIDAALEDRPELADRMAGLDDFAAELGAPLKHAFDQLLPEAPNARLAHALEDAIARAEARGDAALPRDPGRRWAFGAMAASVAAAFAGGLIVGQVPFGGAPAQTEHAAWLDAVEGYVRLFAAETFEAAPLDENARAQSLAYVSRAVGVDLTRLDALPDLAFQRAEMLNFDGRPLAQLVYLDAERRPLAVCVIVRPEDAAPSERSGMARDQVGAFNIVHWDAAPRGFLVIAETDPDALETLAREVRERVA